MLELKRPEGSFSNAPLKKVSFTTLLYVSPVQIIPWCDHTGTPAGLEGFFHFTSSTISGSACLINTRSRESISSCQSPSFLILASINRDGDSLFREVLLFLFFIAIR